ncbi:MAG: DEAD/DEAH box helicase [Deltaproteobacteria bacterium]|nr:DEAD/DEAH box helicase [Candidatus Anaeroferrophillacea bacterium]
MSFNELDLRPELLRAVADEGYTVPTPIQHRAIPAILAGRDVLGGAQTGTGKTAAFALPILQLLATPTTGGNPAGGDDNRGRDPRRDHNRDRSRSRDRRPRCLVLTPTRELAAQVEEAIKTYGRHLPLRSLVIFGGVGINPQIEALRRGIDILVATPGRLLDHVGQKTLDLSAVEILVLDEADRMLDMGFIHDIKKVLAILPPRRQNLLFSATYSDEIRRLADGLLDRPEMIEVARRNTPAEKVDQVVHPVGLKAKRELLARLIEEEKWDRALVFTRTKHGANRLAEFLGKQGIGAAAIHGNKSQTARTRALADFKRGEVRILVATDIAARGLDIDQLPRVVNFDLPNVAEDYIHRIGRTGRAGLSGCAVSLVSADEEKLLKPIERLLGRKIEVKIIDGFAQNPDDIHEETFVDFRGRNGGRGNGGRGGNNRSGESRRDNRSSGAADRNRGGSDRGRPDHQQSDRDRRSRTGAESRPLRPAARGSQPG